MEPQTSQLVLKALIDGIDPMTGEVLPANTVLQHVTVRGALLAAVAALEENAERTNRRSQRPGNLGQPWTADEEERLGNAFRRGEALTAIAERHGRSLTAIEARLERMGLLASEQRTTRNRYVPVAARERR